MKEHDFKLKALVYISGNLADKMWERGEAALLAKLTEKEGVPFERAAAFRDQEYDSIALDATIMVEKIFLAAVDAGFAFDE